MANITTFTEGSLEAVVAVVPVPGEGNVRPGDRKLTFNWKVKSSVTGKTTIEWNLKGSGGQNLYSIFNLELDDDVIYSKNYDTSTSFNDVIIASGTKEYDHNSEGEASITAKINITYLYDDVYINKTDTWYLPINKPYGECYWGTNAAVSIDETIQKPGENITIKWTNANSGTNNNITNFEIQYSLNDGDTWNYIATVAPSVSEYKFALPQGDENRGKTVKAKITIIDTQQLSNPSKAGGACKINTLPAAPKNLQASNSIIPSTQSTISFNMDIGSDAEEKNCTIKYRAGENGEILDYDIGGNIKFENSDSNEVTYYFWTWDKLELSDYSISQTITKNTKPVVKLSIEGESFNTKIVATPEGGQNGSTYTYGYTYKGEDYLLMSSSSAFFNLGDIRSYLSNKLSGLNEEGDYSYNYWVRRNDGIELSEIVYSNELNFTVPKINLSHNLLNSEFKTYFGNTLNVGIDSQNTDAFYYYPSGERNFTHVRRGSQLQSIEFKRSENSIQNFYINLKENNRFTRVYAFEFNNLEFTQGVNPYIRSSIPFSMLGKGVDYGFAEKWDNLCVLTINGHEIKKNSSGSNDTWNFYLTPEHLWGEEGIATKAVTERQTSVLLNLIIKNVFGEQFSTTFTLNFDFKTEPVINNFDLSNNIKEFKEGSQIGFKGEIEYYGQALQVSIMDVYTKKNICNYSISKDKYNINPWRQDEDGGWIKNPYIYNLSNIENYLVPFQEKTYDTQLELIATSAEASSQATSEEITILRHTAPRLRFIDLEYTEEGEPLKGQLTGVIKIEDFGYDAGYGKVETLFVKSNDGEETEIKNIQQLTEWEWKFAIDYNFGNATFQSLAPFCETSFDLDGAKTTKTSEALEYFIVYNILPTVAYRQNYLGINTKDPSKSGENSLDNPAITISAYNQQHMIYLVSSENSAHINLLTGAQNGFIINCGSWDGSGGEVVPGGSQVVYSPYLADLENDPTRIVIFNAGDSKEQI